MVLPDEARPFCGTSALHMAARLGCPRAVEALLAAGADPRARNQQGFTAGDLALVESHRPENPDTGRRTLQLLDHTIYHEDGNTQHERSASLVCNCLVKQLQTQACRALMLGVAILVVTVHSACGAVKHRAL